tara:strand:+ start:2008 stop:2406 length:399 start_codon:yes stop_codon:yes gene_type:complete
MSILLNNYSTKINLDKERYFVIHIPHNLVNRIITRQPPHIENVDTFTILWDNIESKTIECHRGTVINWILIQNNLYLMYSKLFLDHCVFDDKLFISDKSNDIFTILEEPGTYIFSTNTISNCKDKFLIFIIK